MSRSFLLLCCLLFALPAPAAEIDAERLADTVKLLASDFFEGRALATSGEDRTVGYLIGRLQGLGLEPGGRDGSWLQEAPLLHTRLGKPTALGVTVKGRLQPWQQGREVYLTTLRDEDRALIRRAPMVFVGYGVHAPERDWDDFKGVDLAGKVAVFLVNDPDFEAPPGEPVAGRFGGRSMTYYGRWTYKFEEASRRGAIAALIVHDTAGAGYGWNVASSGQGENFASVSAPGRMTSLVLQGWLAGETANKLFRDAGLDLAQLRRAARRADFRPLALPEASFSADVPVSHQQVLSHNVLARIAGRSRPDEVILYGAHWDAYGKGPPDAQGRTVRGGANDDALGVAALLEIARVFKAHRTPARSIVFGFWTGEESGLLGSETYARDPLYPLDRTIANITVDILQTAGRAHDVILVGGGQNELEDELRRLARVQGRTLTPETLPERGLFFRSDHFPFARRGVPVLLMMGFAGASDLVDGGREAGQKWVDDYTGRCYHQPCDAWGPDWDLRGAAEDIVLLYRLGRDLANSNRWPEWKPGSEFKAVRDESAAARR